MRRRIPAGWCCGRRRQDEVPLNQRDERAGGFVGAIALEQALADTAADHVGETRHPHPQRLFELDAHAGLAKRFAAEQDPACEGIRIGVGAQPKVEVDERRQLGNRIATGRAKPGLETGIAARDQIAAPRAGSPACS